MPFMKAFKEDCQRLILSVWNNNASIQERLATQEDDNGLQLHEQKNKCIS